MKILKNLERTQAKKKKRSKYLIGRINYVILRLHRCDKIKLYLMYFHELYAFCYKENVSVSQYPIGRCIIFIHEKSNHTIVFRTNEL